MARYQKISEIGSGAFGTVYRAIRIEDEVTVAMKVLDRTIHAVDGARFEREVRLQAFLNHPNVLHIVGHNLQDTPPWFVTELADRSLRDILNNGAMSEQEAITLFRQLLSGISHAHGNGVIHRDLKPENILIFDNAANNARIGDFGIAKLDPHETMTLTGTGEGMGTLQYVAPEQWSSAHSADGRADIFALGKILYEMLTGDVPPPGTFVDISRVDSKFQYIVQKCLEGNADERFQTVEELRQQFELAIRPSELLEAPIEEARNILEAYISADSGEKASLLRELTRILETNAHDGALYNSYVARLPEDVISDLIAQQSAAFERIISNFDEHVSGSLTFSFTDVVAHFYASVFRMTDSLSIRRIILVRLLDMGVSHNRWHVMDVTVGLFSKIEDVSLAQAAAEVIRNDPYSATHLRDRLIKGSLHSIIRTALEELDEVS